MKIAIAVSLCFVVAVAFVWLGGSERAITEDTAPFETAIEAYCKRKHYGMKVESFTALVVEGEGATGECRMEETEGTYGITVRWSFSFVRDKKDLWKVEQHEAR